MAYFTEEQIREARSIDLLTYLQVYEPTELVHFSGNTWCTREHDSLKISADGRWMWWSRGVGGTSALDYLIKVRGMQFIEAMKILSDETIIPALEASRNEIPPPIRKILKLPERASSEYKVIRYLMGRGIDMEIIQDCIDKGLIYESLPYHNCVFVGYDESGKEAFACYRATNGKRILGDASGSNKQYSFRINSEGSTLHAFESAIDLLSYATIVKMKRGDWRAEPMVSLGGVYVPSGSRTGMKMPSALDNALKNHPDVNTVALHLDNDEAGRGASRAITEMLADRYCVRDEPSPYGKDYNDYLVEIRKRQQERAARQKNRERFSYQR